MRQPRRSPARPRTRPPASRLRLVRTTLGLTLVRVARLADVAIGTLSEVETGRSVPSPGLVARLARVLRVPAATLFPTPFGGNHEESDTSDRE